MSSLEMAAFESNPYSQLALALRKAEETGKDPSARTSSLHEVMEVTREYIEWCTSGGTISGLPTITRLGSQLRTLVVRRPQPQVMDSMQFFGSFCRAIPFVRELTIEGWDASASALESHPEAIRQALATLRSLETLRFRSCVAIGPLVRETHAVPSLRMLSLENTAVGAKDLSALAQLAPSLPVAQASP